MTQIKEMFAPKGSSARSGYAMQPKYITIHNTANTGRNAGAQAHGAYLQGAGSRKSVSYHYAVDDALIVRIIPDKENAWHAGDGAKGTGNRQSLGIEICENPETNLLNATNNAAELTAHLMHDYGIDIDHVVQHNYWTGKNCPNRIRVSQPYNWDTFKTKVMQCYQALYPKPDVDAKPVAKPLDKNQWYAVQAGAYKTEAEARELADKLEAQGFNAFVYVKEV